MSPCFLNKFITVSVKNIFEICRFTLEHNELWERTDSRPQRCEVQQLLMENCKALAVDPKLTLFVI